MYTMYDVHTFSPSQYLMISELYVKLNTWVKRGRVSRNNIINFVSKDSNTKYITNQLSVNYVTWDTLVNKFTYVYEIFR